MNTTAVHAHLAGDLAHDLTILRRPPAVFTAGRLVPAGGDDER